MHSKKILGIIVAIWLFFTPSFIFGKKSPGKLMASVRQEYDLQFTNLKRNLAQQTEKEKKYSLLSQFLEKTAQLRAKNAKQFEEDEFAMDSTTQGLRMLPREAQFEKRNCPNYKTKLAYELSLNRSPSSSSDNRAKDSLKILEILCR